MDVSYLRALGETRNFSKVARLIGEGIDFRTADQIFLS